MISFTQLLICVIFFSTCIIHAQRDVIPEENDDDSSEEPPFEVRLAGGRLAHLGDAPYVVQIRYFDTFVCGGALVVSEHGNHIVVTGGQCVSDQNSKLLNPKYMSIIGGRFGRDKGHFYEQFRAVTKILRHADFKKTYSVFYHDVAVVHIDKPFEFNRLVQDIEMPPRKQKKPEGSIILSGWGSTSPGHRELSDHLRIGVLAMVDLQKCINEYSTLITATIGSRNFCAGTPGSVKWQGGCKGDGGSPAVARFNDTIYLAGTFNYGYPKCGNRYQPSVFTDLSYYVEWIQKMAKP